MRAPCFQAEFCNPFRGRVSSHDWRFAKGQVDLCCPLFDNVFANIIYRYLGRMQTLFNIWSRGFRAPEFQRNGGLVVQKAVQAQGLILW